MLAKYFHAPRMSNRDYSRHMFLVLTAGVATVATGGHFQNMIPLWVAMWIFECIRD